MTTDFSSMDYQSLRSMAQQLDGVRIAAAGQSLVDAAGVLRNATLALYLKREGVVWSGPAADQFGTWTQNLTNSTFQLADFVHNQGTRLTDLGSEVTTAMAAMPKVSDETLEQHAAMVANPVPTLPSDPAAAAAASAALAQSDKVISDAQVAAAAQMRIVAQSYEGTTHVMLLEARPEFQQPADVYRVRTQPEREDYGGATGGAGSSVGGAGAQTSLAGGPSAGSTAYVGGDAARNSGSRQTGSGYSGPGAPVVVRPPTGDANAVQMAVSPPPSPNTTPGMSLSTATPRSSADAPAPASSAQVDATAGSTAGVGLVPGGFKGTARPSGAAGFAGKATGVTRSPAGGASPRRTEGVVGGTPRAGQSPQEGRVGGGRAGMPMSGGVAGSTPTTGGGAAGRSATGRPFSGVPGGAVGGQPANGTPGNRRQFTAGGSGLRTRDTPPSGVSGPTTGGTAHGRPVGGMHGGAAAPPAGVRGRRERADYLAEDDEYWNGRRDDGVPPVIG